MTAPTKPTPPGQVVPKPKPDVQVGVSSFLPWQTPYKGMWEALRTDEVTVKQLMAMRKSDGQARALYRLLTLPIRAALKTATYLPEDGQEGGEEEALFIQQMFTLPASGGGMQVPVGRFLAQMLMALFDGFTAFEMVYQKPTKGPLKGKYTLAKMAHRPSDTLTFILDDQSDWVGLRQQTMYQDRQIDVVIPAEHAFYYAANEEERPYYGQSYFLAAYRHWESKYKLYVISHIAAQRAAVGTRVGTLPPNPSNEEKTDFQRALADLGIAQWMTIPEGFSVDSLKEFTGFDYLSYINHHNSQMSKSILAAFFDDSQGTGGDASLVDFGRQSDALFMMMLQTIMGEIEEAINSRIIPRFIDWNFSSGKYPRFQFGSLTEEQKSALVDLFKTLAVAGQSLTIRPEFVHELEKQISEEFGLEVDWETVEQEMEEEKLAQEQMEQQMAQAQAMGIDPSLGSPGAGGAPGTPGLPTAAAGAPAGAAPPMVGESPFPIGGADIDPSLVPEGFVLTDTGDEALTLTDLAAQLLDEAMIELVRGRPNSGGPKYVRTPEGARVYGVPIGTPITRDMEHRAGGRGVEGKSSGAGNVRGPQPGSSRDTSSGRQKLGGGKGAPATDPSTPHGGGTGAKPQNPGAVSESGSSAKPQRILSNPDEPGAQLIDYGDGTVAIRDAQGRLTPRQRFNVNLFLKFGWKVDSTFGDTKKAKDDDKAKNARAKAEKKDE